MPITKFRTVVLILGSTLVIGACEIFGVVCTTEARPSLRIEILDSITGEPLPDPLVWVQDGLFQDTLRSAEGRASGPYERAGDYDVHVEHAGYEPWLEEGVRVGEDECHVQTRDLIARLQPTGE